MIDFVIIWALLSTLLCIAYRKGYKQGVKKEKERTDSTAFVKDWTDTANRWKRYFEERR